MIPVAVPEDFRELADWIASLSKKSAKYSPDQERDDHGRWTSGGVSVSDTAAEQLATEGEAGGFSYQPFTGTEPKTGFMVAGISQPVSIQTTSHHEAALAVQSYVSSHQGDFRRDPNLYIGGWIGPDGMLVMELAENVADRAEAAATGGDRNQIAVWDVENGREIPTGGTGEFRGG